MKTKILGVAVAAALLGASSPIGAATLFGDVISASYDFPCVGCTYPGPSYSANPFVVHGNGHVETVLSLAINWSVNFGKNSLTITEIPGPYTDVFYNADPFNGPVFTVLSGNSFGSVIGVVENLPHCVPCNPVTAFVLGDSVYINWEGAGGHEVGDSITVFFSVGGPVNASPSVGNLVNAVPEPSTWAMMLIGFAGLGFVANRRQRRCRGFARAWSAPTLA
jgi:PEP-CTERM motif